MSETKICEVFWNETKWFEMIEENSSMVIKFERTHNLKNVYPINYIITVFVLRKIMLILNLFDKNFIHHFLALIKRCNWKQCGPYKIIRSSVVKHKKFKIISLKCFHFSFEVKLKEKIKLMIVWIIFPFECT